MCDGIATECSKGAEDEKKVSDNHKAAGDVYGGTVWGITSDGRCVSQEYT